MAEPDPDARHGGAPPPPSPNVFHLISERRLSELRALLRESPHVINIRSEKGGLIPLHLAAAHGYLEIIEELLVVPGVAIECEDHWGRTPLDVARACGQRACFNALLHAKYPRFFADYDPFF